MTQMITASREHSRPKKVLLYSGGMDSLMLDRLLQPDIRLYVHSQTPYAAQERACVEALERMSATGPVTHLANALDLSPFERDDAIVPNRNAHLVLLASHYGDEVLLAGVSGDRSTDKDDEFCQRITALLDYMWSESHWCEGRRFAVSVPGKSQTKTQLVAAYLKAGGTAESLLRSYSCYEGEALHCGHCKPCFRKWVALVNNGIRVPAGYFKSNPISAPWLSAVRSEIYSGTWRGAEDADIARALDAWL